MALTLFLIIYGTVEGREDYFKQAVPQSEKNFR
jgi:hypothetical protein